MLLFLLVFSLDCWFSEFEWVILSTSFIKIKLGNRCAEPTRLRRRIVITRHEPGTIQNFTHYFTLHPDAFAVNDPHEPESLGARFLEIFFADNFHLFRRDGVQIDHIANLEADGLIEWVLVFGEICLA
jgi:hypothetical protein